MKSRILSILAVCLFSISLASASVAFAKKMSEEAITIPRPLNENFSIHPFDDGFSQISAQAGSSAQISLRNLDVTRPVTTTPGQIPYTYSSLGDQYVSSVGKEERISYIQNPQMLPEQLSAMVLEGKNDVEEFLTERSTFPNGSPSTLEADETPTIYAGTTSQGAVTFYSQNVIPGNTIYITVTNQTGSVVARGETAGGACDRCEPTTARLILAPEEPVRPGCTMTVDFGSGFVGSVEYVNLSAAADLVEDILTVTAPADSEISSWGNHPDGERRELGPVEDSPAGTFTFDYGAAGWDMMDGDFYAARYVDPIDLDVVEYILILPAPELEIGKWTPGAYARPGGVYTYGIIYRNNGNEAAQVVTIVDTLPEHTTWAGDTSGMGHSTNEDGSITWTLPEPLEPGASQIFWVTLNVGEDTPSGQANLEPNCVIITTLTSGDWNAKNDSYCTVQVDVWNDDVELSIDNWQNPNDPAPGQEYDITLQVCNHRGAAAGPLVLTNTFPDGVSLIDWRTQNNWELLWNEDSRGGQLVLSAPGFPGNFCQQIYLRVHVDIDIPIGTQLINTSRLEVDGDVYLENNQRVNTDAYIGNARYDLAVDKWYNRGVLTPQGWIRYTVSFWNSGNMPVQAWITDTLPVGTSYRLMSSERDSGGHFEPGIVTSDHLVWELGEVAVNDGFRFEYTLEFDNIQPDDQVENCVTIGTPYEARTPVDDTACDLQYINDSGSNLRIQKWHNWHGDGQLGYDVLFENIGDVPVENVLITDTLPQMTAWDTWWGMEFDPARITPKGLFGHELSWEITKLYPGESGWLHFNANLDDPGARLTEYINTVEIDVPQGDTNPSDNIFSDIALSKAEVERVEFWGLGDGHVRVWGQAVSDSVLTFDTDRGSFITTVDAEGFWDISDLGQILPGENVTITLDEGSGPVIIYIPDPFRAQADSETNQVVGQIGVGANQRVQIFGNWANGFGEVWTDEFGNFSVDYPDILRGARGHFAYVTEVNNTEIVINRDFFSNDLVLAVNYAHDWIEGRYEVGHTIWITLTESDGQSVKDSIQLTTSPLEGWGWESGFATWIEDWGQDIQTGDWVYGKVDTGQTAEVQVGEITGFANAEEDNITGEIDANWFSEPLAGSCEVWEPEGPPSIEIIVDPDGGSYSCNFNNVGWDLLPGQDIGVRYIEPDADQVINVFEEPAPRIQVSTWGEGNPGAGSNYYFHLEYWNNGGAPAENVVITETLDGFSYVADNAPVVPTTGTLSDGREFVRYDMGDLEPFSFAEIILLTNVDAATGETVTADAQISTTTHFDQAEEGEKNSHWEGQVQESNIRLNMGMNPWTGDPAPDERFIWAVNICNHGSTGTGTLTFTDTLPAQTTLIGWWGQQGWAEVISDTEKLVLEHPSYPSGWCGEIYLDLEVNNSAVPGETELKNIAEVSATNTQPEGTYAYAEQSVWVGMPRKGIEVNTGWNSGTLVPGGELRYYVSYSNNGNINIGETFNLTFTLPANTTFDEVNWKGALPSLIEDHGSYQVWEIEGMRNGFTTVGEIVLSVDDDAVPGTVLTTKAEVTLLEGEDNWNDNTSSWTEVLNDYGPNVRVRKTGDWHGGSWGHNAWYNLIVENVGNVEVEYIWLYDEYPSVMVLAGGPWYDNNNVEKYEQDDDEHRFALQLKQMPPGYRMDIGFDTFIEGDIPYGWVLTNTATIESPEGDTNLDDNEDSVVLKTGPDLYVEQDLVNGQLLPGEIITLSLRIGNDQAWHTWWWNLQGNLLLTNTLPTGFDYLSSYLVFCDNEEPCPLSPEENGDKLIWDLGSAYTGWSNEILLVLQIPGDTGGESQFTNLAEVASSQPDEDIEPNYENNLSSYLLNVGMPAFEVSKEYTGNRVAGTEIAYTITIANTGTYAGTTVHLIDLLPEGFTYVGSSGSYSAGEVEWTIPEIDPSESVERSFHGTLSCQAGKVVTNQHYRVDDSDQGATTQDGEPVSFSIIAPSISARFNVSDSSVEPGGTVSFSSSSSTNGTNLTYTWNFGDGSSASGTTTTHTFEEAGLYEVSLTATDGCGFSDTETKPITVKELKLFLPLVVK